jgi:HTH-type transcriptional regulator, cell division transcriptional repressor
VGQTTSQNLVGKRVKEARSKAQPPLTQEDVAKKLAKEGVSIDRAGIAKIETGIRGVLDFELVALAKALSVKVTWLLGIKD